MSLPGIFRRLFGNEGAGPRLRPEIIPPHADTHSSAGSDPITPESIGAARASASGGAASADVAKELETPRTISLSGDATGSVGFDGSADVSIPTAIIGLVPVGGVVAFSGAFNGRNPVDMKSKQAMTGWCLCDGTTTNGLAVPDLRDRMIMGAGTTCKTGDRGGAATHTHSVSGTVGETTLTVEQSAAHAHKSGNSSRTHGYLSPGYGGYVSNDSESATFPTTTVGSSQPHTHSLSGVESGSASSLPPYYALAFIMRCA